MSTNRQGVPIARNALSFLCKDVYKRQVFIGLALIMPINRMLAGLCVIVAAMPIAGNCSMLSDIYTPEDMTASHATIVSTLISGVTPVSYTHLDVYKRQRV